jgi:rhodanese-related sulfurtransferase
MKPTRVSASEAREMFDRGEGAVFVDARNPVANVKLPGAVTVPIDEVDSMCGSFRVTLLRSPIERDHTKLRAPTWRNC